ncbi:MAG: hypothetical protein ACRDQZ_13165 [Mycobacteriales bacterium]
MRRLTILLLVLLAGCSTYQVMDMKRVPKHPRPDSAAQFPVVRLPVVRP